ncbi:MAG TPA: tetratricopeptide repeat protein [Kofleriaceae bacterium]
MIRRVTALACLAVVAGRGNARADEPSPDGPIPPDLRRAYEDKDYETVRRELLKAYTVAPRPELLFALGQVELNLGNYEAAIRYYEQFIAQNPSDEQIALAQQAIGAARMRMAQPKPVVVKPVPRPAPPAIPPRQWYAEDSGLVALGGAAVVVGGGLLYYSHRLGEDHGGTLSQYDERVRQSRSTMWTGVGIAAAGAVVIGVTVLRWRLRPDGSALSASVAPGAATFALSGRW